MPYSIFMLPEGLITVTGATGGDGLDGVTQGDGSHLIGAMITLNSNDWVEIEINDDDANFQDNDGGQTLVNAETINSDPTDPAATETFAAGTGVQAEYGVIAVGPGPDFIEYQLVAVNFGPGFATNEGLAFIGPSGGFPPIGVPLTVTSNQEGPSFVAATYATPICFAAGTLIAAPDGDIAVEDLAVGNMVTTREGGAEVVRWIGRRSFPAVGRFAPVEFAPGAIGNTQTLRVSRQHRLRLTGWRAELFFGEDAVWVPAVHFLGRPGVHLAEGGEVTYFHILLDGHRTLIADGVEAESLHPGDVAMCNLDDNAEAEVLAMFPELDGLADRATSHLALRAAEARAILTA